MWAIQIGVSRLTKCIVTNLADGWLFDMIRFSNGERGALKRQKKLSSFQPLSFLVSAK